MTPARSRAAGSTSRGSARSSTTRGRPPRRRWRGCRSGPALEHVPDRAGAGDDEVGRGERRAAARPARTACAADRGGEPLRAVEGAVGDDDPRRARTGLATVAASAPIEPAPTTRTSAPSSGAEHARRPRSSPAVTSERPARSMPVSVWARLPTRSACCTSSLSDPADGAARPARCAARARPGRGSGSRRRPSSRGRRPPRTGARRPGPRSARRGAGSARRGRPRRAGRAARTARRGRRGTCRRRRRPRPGCRWRAPAPRRRGRWRATSSSSLACASPEQGDPLQQLDRRAAVGQADDEDAHVFTTSRELAGDGIADRPVRACAARGRRGSAARWRGRPCARRPVGHDEHAGAKFRMLVTPARDQPVADLLGDRRPGWR